MDLVGVPAIKACASVPFVASLNHPIHFQLKQTPSLHTQSLMYEGAVLYYTLVFEICFLSDAQLESELLNKNAKAACM